VPGPLPSRASSMDKVMPAFKFPRRLRWEYELEVRSLCPPAAVLGRRLHAALRRVLFGLHPSPICRWLIGEEGAGRGPHLVLLPSDPQMAYAIPTSRPRADWEPTPLATLVGSQDIYRTSAHW
jgi:hypothetical protein